MKKATLTTTGIEVYIREDKTPTHNWNKEKVVVSKQPNSNATFCVNLSDLKTI